MKRLLTLIGVVATLLLTPTNAKAWGDLYLLNNIWGSWGSTDTNSDYKFTMVNDNEFTYTLDASDYEGDIYWKINTPGDWSGQREIHPDNNGYDVGEGGYNAKYDESYSGKSFKISHSTNNYTHYTITAKYHTDGGGYWYVKVEGSGSKGTTQAVYLLGTINSWTGNSYKLEKDGDEYKLELTKAQVQNALQDGDFYFRFKEEMDNSKTYTVVPQTDQTALTVDGDYTSDTYATTKTDDSKKDFYWKFTPTGADKYFIYFKNENNTRKVRVATPPHDYYWVSPQITNGEMWPAFKMVASRNRYWDGHQVIGDGKISTKYYTFTIKDDDLVTWKTKSEIGTDTEIQWYILRDDGQVVYRPATDLVAGYKPHNNVDYDTNHPISGNTDNDGYVSFINYWNGYGGDVYMTTAAPHNEGSWKFLKGNAKAHTFNLNAEKGHVLYNYTKNGASTTRGYNLVGNWTANTKASIHLSEGKPMTKYWFKEGVGHQIADNEEVADADSIVYKIDITKEALGINSWGGLYLDISPKNNGTEDNDANWGRVFRPLITTGNILDGRALHGALTTRKDEQSLNPETSENYLGYTFSFNATTMTYRLEFHTPDATLSPGTEDGNVDFKGSVSEDIAVDLTDGSDGIHTEATQYAIGFGADANFDLSETNKYTDTEFNLSFNGSTNEITYTSAGGNNYTGTVSGCSIYVKVRGFDSTGQNYGDIHTYKYTFHSNIGFEPHGGLFINSAKINITGGVAPYKYEIWHYDTTIKNGETVIDYTTGTLRSSGTFSNTSPYDVSDDNFRISTPGFLKIIDKNGDAVSFEEVGGGFDFTYSTSENYKPYYSNTAGGYSTINANDAGAYPNGADYWLAAPGDMTRLLSPTWHLEGSTETRTANDVQPSWNGEDDNTIPLNTGNEIYQTVTGLTAGTYTVQAIVRGEAKPIHLKLDDNVVNTITLTGDGDGDGSIASINPYGRCEHLENMQESTSNRSWHKLEGSADVTAGGSLKIAISAEGRAYVADVVLLKDANTLSGFRTTASTLPTDITRYDFRRRQVSGQPSQRQNNAYSFFDRGKNQNAVIFANNKTVIAMDPANLADVPQNATLKAQDRRHPFNVVGSTEQDAAQGTAKALYLTDAGYDPTDANCLPVRMGTSGDANYNSTNYRTHGYSFCPGLAFYAEDLIFDRNMSEVAVRKTTCMLPVSFTPAQLKTYYGSELKVYKWSSRSDNDLTFALQDENTALNANEPYIFWGAEGSLDTRGQSAGKTDGKFTIGAITSTDHNAAASHSGFPGTYAYKKITRYGDSSGAGTADVSQAAETRFVYSATKGVFSVVSASGTNVKPFRAYFVVPVTDAAASAPQLTLFFDDSIITGIDSVETTAPTSGDIYTIGGVLVAKDGNMSGLPKGIYIMNGKKYVVK